jgi:hypothetical protein
LPSAEALALGKEFCFFLKKISLPSAKDLALDKACFF